MNTKVKDIDIKAIINDENQPRKSFDEGSINELSSSIKKYGIIQPIAVFQDGQKYRIIAGERRYRAAIKAGLNKVPCIIRESNDIREVSILENIQRESLNPIEEARAIKSLMEEKNLNQNDIASILSKSRSYIANILRLLKLDTDTITLIERGLISEGHGKALLSIKEDLKRREIVKKILEEKISVRETEKLAKELKKEKISSKDIFLKDIENRLSDLIGTKVFIEGNSNKGKLSIEFYSENQLEGIIEQLFSLE